MSQTGKGSADIYRVCIPSYSAAPLRRDGSVLILYQDDLRSLVHLPQLLPTGAQRALGSRVVEAEIVGAGPLRADHLARHDPCPYHPLPEGGVAVLLLLDELELVLIYVPDVQSHVQVL